MRPLQAGSGTITATRGSVYASIPVTVESNHPFEDLSGHWAEAYMGQLYQQKILNTVPSVAYRPTGTFMGK